LTVDPDRRIEEVLGEWYAARDSGRPLDPSELIRDHPDLAAELQIHFQLMDAFGPANTSEQPRAMPERLGPYAIHEELGIGGMGTVYRAEGPEGTVAIKVLHAHLLKTPGLFKRFLREAEVGKRVDHAGVVRTLDVDAFADDERSYHYLVMEYVEGQTLREMLLQLDKVPEELCRHIGREVAAALEAIHAVGVVHRDLKPENVLITRDHQVKVMDLGIAHLIDQSIQLSIQSAFVGSVLYAAPEQFGKEPLDHRADWYALGLMLYELATGQHPSKADDFASVMHARLEDAPRPAGQVNPQLSAYFEEVIQGLLAKDREERLEFFPAEDSEWWRARARAIRQETKRPLRRIRVPRETAVYGRDEELAKLRTLFEKAKVGEGQVVLVEGEAGIGKTRLVDEFVLGLGQVGEDVNFLFGSYPPGGAASALGGFSTAFREHFGEDGSADQLKQTPLLVPLFDAVLRGEPAPEGAGELTAVSVATCFVHATQNLADERTTIVLIDDLHFASADARDLFMSLGRAISGHRVLLVGTTRPGLPADWIANATRLEETSHLLLDRLSPKDLALLLKDSFRSERLAEELGYKVALKSDGNPFFVFEIIRGLREGQFIAQRDDGTWFTTRVIEDIEIPSSVLDLVNARMGDLSEQEQRLLDVAACLGFEFEPEIVASVAGLGPIPALQSFASIEKRHRLVRSAARKYVFDHHQVQEAVYAALHESLREHYHVAIADALESRTGAADADPATLDGALCVDLCEHLFKGARGARALRYLDAALTYLEKGFLSAQAAGLAERALNVPELLTGCERVTLLLRLVPRLNLLGRLDDALAALEEARTRADETADPCLRGRARSLLGPVLSKFTGQRDAAIGALHEAQELARTAGDRKLEGQVAANLGVTSLNLGNYDEALQNCETAIALTREVGNRQDEARVIGVMGRVLQMLGRLPEAKEQLESHLSLSRELGNRLGEAIAVGNLGTVCQDLGRYAEAQRHYEDQLALSRELGNRPGEAQATSNLGNNMRSQGRFAEARALIERGAVLYREVGDAQEEANAVGNLGALCSDLGRFAEAKEHFERYLSLSRQLQNRLAETIAIANLGVVFLEVGRYAEARDHYQRQLALSRELGSSQVEGYALAALAELTGCEGDTETAIRLYREMLSLRRERGESATLAVPLVELGVLEAARGETKTAVAHMDEALELASKAEDPRGILSATVERARLPDGDAGAALAAFAEHGERVPHQPRMSARFRLWQMTGDHDHLEEAHRLLRFARDHAPEHCQVSIIENVPLNRAVMRACEEHEKQDG
jgi:serine/threonine protein kinase/tetratricopeptide (TPR) repeat protein